MERFINSKLGVARLSVTSNAVLVLLKLAVGLSGGAISILSEAVHSIIDLVASSIAFFAVRQADRPPDGHHTYGHGKIESLSGVIESLLMIFAALWIIYEALAKLQRPGTPEFLDYGIGVMLLSVLINWHVSGKLFAVAGRTGSHALEADALHLRADVWTSLGVLSGLCAIKLTGFNWLDPVIAIAVAALIIKAGFSMTRKSLRELTDVSLPPEDEKIIRRIINDHPEIISFHRLRTRRSGSRRLIDVSIFLDRNMNLNQAHAICDEIEAEIAAFFAPCDTVIHLEPSGVNLSLEKAW